MNRDFLVFLTAFLAIMMAAIVGGVYLDGRNKIEAAKVRCQEKGQEHAP